MAENHKILGRIPNTSFLDCPISFLEQSMPVPEVLWVQNNNIIKDLSKDISKQQQLRVMP